MSIKKHAFYNISSDETIGLEEGGKNQINCTNHAMVIMARGLASNWKQPTAYFICENSYSHELDVFVMKDSYPATPTLLLSLSTKLSPELYL